MDTFWRRSSLATALLVAAWWGSPTAQTADIPPETMLTYKARRLLDEDENLSAFNIGIVVRNGSATLIGKLPSQDLVDKAEAVVRKLKGLNRVRNEIEIGPLDDLKSLRIQADSIPAPRPRKTETVSLLPPVVSPEGGEPKRSSPAALLTPLHSKGTPNLTSEPIQHQVASPKSRGDMMLAAAIQELRWTDARYVGVKVEVRNGTVFLRGQVSRGEDAMDLARKVSRIQGVEGVVLETKEAPNLPGRTP